MFVKIQREKELIKVSQAPARVVDVRPDGSISVEVEFELAQQAYVRGRSVRTTLLLRSIDRHEATAAWESGEQDVEELVGRIVSIVPAAKAAQKASELLILAQRITTLAAVDQSSVPVLHGRRLARTRVGELRRSAESISILRATMAKVQRSAVAARESSLADLMLRGVDPSSRVGRGGSQARAAAGGLVPDASDAAAVHSTSDELGTEQAVALVAQDEPRRHRRLSERLYVPAERMVDEGRPVDHALLRLELLDSTGASVDVVTLGLDIARHVIAFRTPRAAPGITIARTHTGMVLKAQPGDRSTTAMRIFRRGVPSTGPTDAAFTLVGEFQTVNAHAGVHLQLPPVRSGVVVYRAVPVGHEGLMGAEFASVVALPSLPSRAQGAVVTVAAVLGGLSVEVSGIPMDVCSLEFMRRDLTRRDAAFTVVGGCMRVDDQVRLTGKAIMTDRELTQGHVYEHCVRLTHVDGKRETAGSVHTEYSAVQEGRSATAVTNLQVDRESGSLDVSFNMATNIVESEHDVVKSVLERQGISTLFLQDVLQERERLRDLLVHRVTRIDLTTGDREDFGTVTGDRFIDSAWRTQAGVRPLEEGKKYRYEIEALVRAPETMFDELVKVKTDPGTRRQYLLQPAKHLHPVTRTRGTITSRSALATRHAQGAFGHGRIGSMTTVEVSFSRPTAFVVGASAAVLDVATVVVAWRVQGDPSTVDHFVIRRSTTDGVQTVGKCHAGFPHGSFQFFDTVDDDAGPASYIITPVAMDLSEGDSVQTDEVEAPRS